MTPMPLATILSDVSTVTSALFTSIGTAVNTLTQYPILMVFLFIGISGALIGVGLNIVKSVRG
jgi:hypothetical protein